MKFLFGSMIMFFMFCVWNWVVSISLPFLSFNSWKVVCCQIIVTSMLQIQVTLLQFSLEVKKWLQLGSWLVSQSVRDCGKVHDDWQFLILSCVQILLPWKRLFVQLNVMDWSGKQVSLILILANENGWSVIHSHHGT